MINGSVGHRVTLVLILAIIGLAVLVAILPTVTGDHPDTSGLVQVENVFIGILVGAIGLQPRLPPSRRSTDPPEHDEP